MRIIVKDKDSHLNIPIPTRPGGQPADGEGGVCGPEEAGGPHHPAADGTVDEGVAPLPPPVSQVDPGGGGEP